MSSVLKVFLSRSPLARALWFRMGIGYTDPGTPLQHGASRYERYARFVDSNTQVSGCLGRALGKEILLDTTGRCRWVLRKSTREGNTTRQCRWVGQWLAGMPWVRLAPCAGQRRGRCTAG